MYDLEKDPHELTSVYDDPAYAEIRQEMKAELERLQEKYGDTEPHAPLWQMRDPDLLEHVRAVELERVVRTDQRGTASVQPDPSRTPITAGAWITPERPGGVVLAQGGQAHGYTLFLADGVPRFGVRGAGNYREVAGPEALEPGRRVHLAGVLDADAKLRLYVDGEKVAEAEGLYIPQKPAVELHIGRDVSSMVGPYGEDNAFGGTLHEVRIYRGVLEEDALREWAAQRGG